MFYYRTSVNSWNTFNAKVGAKLNMSNITDKQSDWKNREVGALWKKAAANGKSSYCTGYLVTDELGAKVKQRVIMFANKTKNNEKSPDFIIYLSNEQDNGDTATPSAKATKTVPQKKIPQAAQEALDNDDDGVPM